MGTPGQGCSAKFISPGVVTGGLGVWNTPQEKGDQEGPPLEIKKKLNYSKRIFMDSETN